MKFFEKKSQGVPIGIAQIRAFDRTLRRYREGKASLERRVVENEQWWKLRGNADPDALVQGGAYLWNTVEVKHSDTTAAYPEPCILPREKDDEAEAARLSDILPVVLEQNDFRTTWSEVNKYKLKQGTGVYGVFWDGSKHGGLGDISIRKVDLLRLFWEPGINDIQDSRYVFLTELVDADVLDARYPHLDGKWGKSTFGQAKYLYDDSVDTSGKALVVDVYYKVEKEGRTVLHYCKYSGETVIYSTENDTAAPTRTEQRTAPDGTLYTEEVPVGLPASERGLYDHGLYPFVTDALFGVEGSIAGYGYIDIGKSVQTQIDLMDRAFIKSTLANCTPRYLYKASSAVSESEFADFTKPFVRVEGSLDENSIREIPHTSLSGNFLNVYQMKVNELKEVLGNRDVANGGTISGVTAASAIATLQEVSGRMSRDSTRDAYNAYKKVIGLCIELIRQFYTLPRTFRITGAGSEHDYVEYTNSALAPRAMDGIMGQGMRLPVFDIEVTAQSETEYTKQNRNEMALQFFSLGFFNPKLADQALACLDSMDFDRKEALKERISRSATLAARLEQVGGTALSLAEEFRPELVEPIAAALADVAPGKAAKKSSHGEAKGIKRARARAQSAPMP